MIVLLKAAPVTAAVLVARPVVPLPPLGTTLSAPNRISSPAEKPSEFTARCSSFMKGVVIVTGAPAAWVAEQYPASAASAASAVSAVSAVGTAATALCELLITEFSGSSPSQRLCNAPVGSWRTEAAGASSAELMRSSPMAHRAVVRGRSIGCAGGLKARVVAKEERFTTISNRLTIDRLVYRIQSCPQPPRPPAPESASWPP